MLVAISMVQGITEFSHHKIISKLKSLCIRNLGKSAQALHTRQNHTPAQQGTPNCRNVKPAATLRYTKKTLTEKKRKNSYFWKNFQQGSINLYSHRIGGKPLCGIDKFKF
jgi:hypothetical protein